MSIDISILDFSREQLRMRIAALCFNLLLFNVLPCVSVVLAFTPRCIFHFGIDCFSVCTFRFKDELRDGRPPY